MAISTEFMELFEGFINQYEKGNDGYFSKSSEDRLEKTTELRSYFDLFTRDKETFTDVGIIEAFHSMILGTYKSHPFLLQCWGEFFTKYNETKRSFPSFLSPKINSNPKASPAEKLLFELKNSLTSMMSVHASTQQLMMAEIERLSQQVADLTVKLDTEKEQVIDLQLQIRDQSMLRAMQPQVVETSKQLAAAATLLTSLSQQLLTAPIVVSSASPSTPKIVSKPSPAEAKEPIKVTPTPPPIPASRPPAPSSSGKPPTPTVRETAAPHFFSQDDFLHNLQQKINALNEKKKAAQNSQLK